MIDVRRLVHQGVAEGALRYALLRPILLDPAVYESCRSRLAREIVRSGLSLFPDLEEQPGLAPGEESSGSARSPAGDALGFYLREVRRFSPLGRAEEGEFARALEVARSVLEREMRVSLPPSAIPSLLRESGTDSLLLDALRPIARPRPGPPGEKTERLGRVRLRLRDARRVRRLFVTRSLQLVPLFARRYRTFGVPPLDLIQEGNAALFRAAEKFDWRKGVRFSTYAQWWIQQAILKFLYSQARVVRLPVYLGQKLKRLGEARGDYYGRFGRYLTPEELAENLEEPLARTLRALRSAAPVVSLDRSPREGEAPLSDRLPDPHTPEIRDEPSGPPLRHRIDSLLVCLPSRERTILRLRYGLGGMRPRTLEELSEMFSVSRERVRQLQVRALERVRERAGRVGLAAFLS
ncbi:MAG: sigma-70 family RNA polymerase sigma factor [Planctomycetota bacterium]